MDLKTLNRIDTLRRRRSRGPETPEWIKRYHPLISALMLLLVIVSLLIGM